MTRIPLIKSIILITLIVGMGVIFFAYIQNSSAPSIQSQFDDTRIDIRADQAWVLQSGGCLTVTWNVEGINAIYINSEGKIGEGELEFCPQVNATSPLIEVIDNDDVYRTFRLDIRYLPDFVFYLLGFVGLAFTIVFTIYQLWIRHFDKPFPIWGMLVTVLFLAIFGGLIRLSSAPTEPINQQYDDISLSYWANHNLIIFPDECVQVTWSVVGASQINFNGQDVTGLENPASGEHCTSDDNTATLEIVANDGEVYTHTLSIPSLFPHVEHTTLFVYWSLIGIILAVLIYIPLLIQKLRQVESIKQEYDWVVIAGFFMFILLLYLPFGFTSIGHWEEWIINAYIEGKQADIISSEMVSRFWVIVPHTLAYIISSESFIGYHLVNFLMFWGKLVLLYGIFRHLNVSRLYAFLATILFMVYPVNSALMSLRSFPMQFSMISLLLATFLVLDYRKAPTRLHLLGIWLALTFNVTSNESAYVIILVIPLLWCLKDRKISWEKFNLTAIWYLYPAFKVAWLLFLSSTERNFYQSGIVNTAVGSSEVASDNLGIFSRVMQAVYRNTFVDSWQDAFGSVEGNPFIFLALVMTLLVICMAWWLSRESITVPSLPRIIGAIFAGFLFIIPSVGVLMWIPLYRNDLWRMYFYIPIGATIVVIGLVVLITRFITHEQFRRIVVLVITAILIFPSTTRLLSQHATYVTSANNKAKVISEIIEQAPQVDPSTHIILTTAMTNEQLQQLEIFEFVRRDMLDSVFAVIYRDHPPQYAYFCLIDGTCSTTDAELTLFYPVEQEVNYQNILLFEVYDDLSVKLLDDLPASLGFPEDNQHYNPSLLIHSSTNVPSRANTMLTLDP